MTQIPPNPSVPRTVNDNGVDYAASASAPFVVFDGVHATGINNNTAAISLAAVRFLTQKQDATGRMIVDPDTVVIAHLRGDLTAFRHLRQAIDEVERLFVARQQIAAAEATAGASDATMQ